MSETGWRGASRSTEAACAGKSFEARRDTALITLLLDTGARRGAVAGLRVTDIDFDLDVAIVLGKGRRERALPFGHTTAVALDRYLRVRARHEDAALPWRWRGLKGRLTAWGLVIMLRRRSRQAGLPGLHPHLFRHTFAHTWRAEGGSETDLMRITGWRSPAMLRRYGASAADASPGGAPTLVSRGSALGLPEGLGCRLATAVSGYVCPVELARPGGLASGSDP